LLVNSSFGDTMKIFFVSLQVVLLLLNRSLFASAVTSEETVKSAVFAACSWQLNSTTRPADSMSVSISIVMQRFVDIDDQSESFTNYIKMYMSWLLPCASWSNNAQFANVTAITLNHREYWHPVTLNTNNFDDIWYLEGYAAPSYIE
jgi:hypothetical protein